ncbi:MAG: cation diffusion facilitator family transporter [Flavobacteriales bacterium]
MAQHSHPDTHTCTHDHGHDHAHGNTTRAIVWALILNAVFTVIEFTAGSLSHSAAVLSDAVHDLGDCFTIGFALVLQRYAGRKADRRFPFGYGRLSAASAFVTSLILITGSVFMLVESAQRILEDDHQIRTTIVIPVAIAGLLFNGLAARFLFHGHTHDPGHARKAIALHFIEDILGWAAVLAGSIIIHFTGYTAIDSILSAGISLFILYQALRNLLRVVPVFFDTLPASVNAAAAELAVVNIFGEEALHQLRIWTIDGSSHAAIVSLKLPATVPAEELSAQKEALRRALSTQQIHTVYFDLV